MAKKSSSITKLAILAGAAVAAKAVVDSGTSSNRSANVTGTVPPLTTIRGEKGEKGDPGDSGVKGDKGDKGEKGEKGDTGLQGLMGATGSRGLKGDPGAVVHVAKIIAVAPSSSPESEEGLAYTPTEDGTYTNFSGLVVSEAELEEGLVTFVADAEGDFHKQVTTFPVFGAVAEGELKPVSGDSVYKAIIEQPIEISLGAWASGFYLNRSGAYGGVSGWHATGFVKINPAWGTLVLKGNIVEGATANNVSFYDKNKVYISGYYDSETDAEITLPIPSNAEYVRLSNFAASGTLSINVMLLDLITTLLNDKSPKLIRIPLGELLDGRFLRDTGAINAASGWLITKNYVPILEGAKYFFTGQIGNASTSVSAIAFYADKDPASFISALTIPGDSNVHTFINHEVTVPAGAKYALLGSNVGRIQNYELYTDEFSASKALAAVTYNIERETIPNIVLPAYVDVVKGRANNIWFDNITNFPGAKNVLVQSHAADGIIRRGHLLSISPASDASNITVTARIYNDRFESLKTKDVIFRPVSKSNGNGTDVINICVAGDSLIDSAHPTTEMYRLLAEDGDFVINQIGTRGAASKHEGRASWAWSHFVSPLYETTEYAGKTNAFMKDGELDFENYMLTNFPSLPQKIDIFIMSLGTNDVSRGFPASNAATLNTIITNAKTFIDALLTDFPDCKVVIGLPSIGAPVFPTSGKSQIAFQRSISLLNEKYISEFDNGTYHENVTTVMHGAYIDRHNGFPYVDEQVDEYITSSTIRRWTDDVHPNLAGYKQWGRGYYGKVRAILNGVL